MKIECCIGFPFLQLPTQWGHGCFGSSVNDFEAKEEEETAFSFFSKRRKNSHAQHTQQHGMAANRQGIALYHNNNKQATAWQCMHVFQAGMDDVFSLT